MNLKIGHLLILVKALQQTVIWPIGGLRRLANIARAMLIATLATVSVAAAAQAPPRELQEIMATPGGEAVTIVEKLSPAQRAFFWRDSTSHPHGYLLNKGASALNGFIKGLSARAAAARPVVDVRDKRCDVSPGFEVVYRWQESSFRATWLLKQKHSPGRMLAYTAWKFAEQKSRVFLMREFLNTSVNGALATLSLSVSESVPPQGQWTLNWIVGGTQHEMYVDDDIVNGDVPTLSVAEVKAMASVAVLAGCI
jgi:hypothetical protein